MALPAIAVLAIKIGAPILANVLSRRGGVAGSIAGETIETIAEKLDTEPTEEAIASAYEHRPEKTAEVFKQVETDFARMAEAAAEANQSYHGLLAGDRDSLSLLNRLWRPFNGFMFALEIAAIVGTVAVKIAQGDVQTLTALQPLYAFLGTILGTHAGVVGAYVWRRTDEKLGSKA